MDAVTDINAIQKTHTHIWPTISGQITVSGIYSVSIVCLPCTLVLYSHYTSIHMKCTAIGSKTNTPVTQQILLFWKQQNIYILFF
jgi:hypothetical protein